MPIEKNKILNPKTGRFVLKTSALGKKILKEMNDLKELKKKEIKKKEIKIKQGYEIINEKLYKLCKDGQIRNPKTNRCIKNKNKEINEVIDNEINDNDNKEIQEEDNKDNYQDANEEFEEEEDKINLTNFYTYFNYPLNYEFNKSNVEKFLDACDDITRPIAKKIIDNTRHVSFKEMLKLLNLNLKEMIELLKKDRPLFIYIYKYLGVERSNYWIYLYLKDYVNFYKPNQEIIILTGKVIDNENLINDDIIIMIDDVFYTGSTISDNIKLLIFKNDFKLNIFILAPFISRYAKNLIKRLSNDKLNIILNSHTEFIPITNDYLTNEEMNLLTTYYSYYDSFNSHYNIIFEFFSNKLLLYFDHKIGYTRSNVQMFYSGIVPNSYNKKLFNENSDISKNLEIIPLLKNCEDVKDYEYDSKCPISPYKDNIDDIFIEKKVINPKTKSKSNILLDLWKKIKF